MSVNKIYVDHLGNGFNSVKKLCESFDITVNAYYQRLKKGWTLEKTLTTPLKPCRADHTGETRLNNDGLTMTIIDSPDTHHITVKFLESGHVRNNCYYGDFCRGMIKDRIAVEPDKIIGEKRIMNCGSVCEVMDYKKDSKGKYNIITVKFENGCVKTTRSDRYLKGEISDKKYGDKTLVGKSRIARNGEKYTVVSEDKEKCIVRFENGVEKHYSRKTVRTNQVSSCLREEYTGVYSKGKIITSEENKHYCIIEDYGNGRFVDIKSDDNVIEYHVKPLNILHRKGKKEILAKRVNAVIGEKSLTSSLKECEIVGGTGLENLDVKLSDGSVLHHQSYYKFKKGLICEKNLANTIIERKRYENVGEKCLQSCGLNATCVEYNNRNDIVVEFDDGTRRKTDINRFRRGKVVYNPEIKKGTLSINEYILRQCFKDVGFIKMPCGSLKYLEGFKNRELDLYSPKYKIAIEYDGYFHSLKQSVKKDNEKDALCAKHGITIYRIREEGVPLLNNGISIEYALKDNHEFGPELRNAIYYIAKDISAKTGLNIKIPDLQKTHIRDKIMREFAKNDAFLSRVNEINYNLQGEKMKIFEYLNSSKVGIKFENGYTTWRTYSEFKKGNIKCLYNHYGEENISLNGQKMQIISNRYGNNIDVQFEDGTIVKNQYYWAFLKKAIANPNFIQSKDSQCIGEKITAKNGLTAEIIKVRRERKSNGSSVLKVIARFEDGQISSETTYPHFKEGYVKHPKLKKSLSNKWYAVQEIKKQANKEKIMKKQYISIDGHNFKIIDYKDSKHVRVKFEDGFELNSSMGVIQNKRLKRFLSVNVKRNVG